ncbi:MAG: alpha-L-fucosidase [Spirochaetales bacterium]|jgi:alpha-L-fucosidase|nr:alpha-L-fucosidase [Spirochaetales bacterium]
MQSVRRTECGFFDMLCNRYSSEVIMAAANLKERISWWEEVRFGMFIHWGLYAVPAGVWKGEEIPGIGEWIMYRAQIPVDQYEQLAPKFNPVKFDAKEWVGLAKEAGMKYLVITAKHHDGFALFKSKVSDYNIVDATPYSKDPMKDLAKACKSAGIKLCFYYSQDQDWHEPGGRGNTWDFGPLSDKAFARYLENKVKPQLEELLTQYGPIGLIWFDTPGIITKKQSQDLKRYVHKIQPDCLVSGRVGHDVGDYGSMGDNMIPAGRVKGYWETPATLNDTWGFKKNDKNWKSTKELLILLVDLASKGVNYLLNVGPTDKGVIPPASVKRLKEIGAWMKVNGDAIYRTNPSPYPYEFKWGRITCKPGKMYLHLYDWPKGSFLLKGLKTAVFKAYPLADKKRKLDVTQTYDGKLKEHSLQIGSFGKKTDKFVSVVVLELDGDPKVDQSITQQPGGLILLPAHMAVMKPAKKDTEMLIDRSGIAVGWRNTGSSLSWEFKVSEPGEFAATLSTAAVLRPREWVGGHTVELAFGRGSEKKGIAPYKTIKRKIRKDSDHEVPRTKHLKEALSGLGTVSFSEPGTYTVEMSVSLFPKKAANGIQVSFIELRRQLRRQL